MGYKLTKRDLHILSLSGIALALPLSEWLLSVFIIVQSLIWILAGGLTNLKKLTDEKKNVIVFTGVWFVYLAWMINSGNLSYGLKELKLKLPLLLLPVTIGLSDPLSRKELKVILSAFIAGVVISSVYGTVSSLKGVIAGNASPENLSPFISHVRLAVMTVFAATLSGWYYFTSPRKRGVTIIYLMTGLWLTIFLFILTTLTGFVLMSLVIFVTLRKLFFGSDRRVVKSLIFIFFISALATVCIFVFSGIKAFYPERNKEPGQLPEVTLNGNPYLHDRDRKDIENGNRVWINISESELRKEWGRRSEIPYDSADKKGQEIKYTLIRYLASAGMKKDSAAISKLTDQDIINIEGGMSNILFPRWSAIKTKLYGIIWQIDYYRNGGNPSGHPVTQRIVFWETGWHVFLRFPFFGTGTGDIADEFKKQYTIDISLLDIKHRFLSHNQFLTFLATFGIAGFILVCLFLFLPLSHPVGWRNYISAIFILVVFLSMLWEDTLQTHTGVSFFAYFYSLFIFGTDNNDWKNEQK